MYAACSNGRGEAGKGARVSLERVSLMLPRKLLIDAQQVASAQDVTIGHLVRKLLGKEVDRRLRAKTSERADERLVAALQALLATDMALARGWDDLFSRLAAHGFELRPAGGGLTLHKLPCGQRLCKASDLGFSYRTFVARFQAPLPGHPHGGAGVLPGSSDDESFDVIDRSFH